jgi:hypothetical protein
MALFKVLFGHLTRGTQQDHKNFSQDGWSLGRGKKLMNLNMKHVC